MSSRLKTTAVTVSTVLVSLLLMGAMLGSPSDKGAYPQISVYTEVLSRIKSEYVEEPDIKSVTLGAMTGLLEALDPFASYLSAEQYKEYQRSKGAEKADVGLVLCRRGGTLTVVDAIPGSPASKAGLNTFDWIETIRGIATRDMPLAYAEMLLQGKAGTTIEITVLSMRQPEPRKITLTRAAIDYPKITENLMPDNVGYIQVQSMISGTAKEIATAVRNLEKKGAKRLILDLRHCATGPPQEGVQVANLFQDKGLLSYLQGQRVSREDYKADPAKAITSLPLVVLTNRGTASAAEVAAAALLDNKRAEVVGERTYGDASVRQPISMDDGGAIILSVAKYYSPAGKAIQDTGVTPTVQVTETEPPVDDEDDTPEPEPQPQPATPDQDPVLKKALEVLTKGAPKTAQSPEQAKPEMDQRNLPPLTERPKP